VKEHYKESGVNWIGKIPLHWSMSKIGHLYEVQLGKMIQPERKLETDKNVPYLKAINVQDTGLVYDTQHKMYASSSDLTKYDIEKGDLLVCEGGEIGRSALVKKEYKEFIFQNSLHRIRSISNNVQFLHYIMQAIRNSGYINVLVNRLTIAHLTREKLVNVKVAVPSKSEQDLIVSFLNRKTSEIDTLIEDKEKLIQLLEEKRQAIITEAVTKGLDPDVQMKDSGVEWIGEIPKHWTTSKIKYLSNHHLIYGANASAELDDEDLPRYIRITDIDKNGDLRDETFKSLTKDIASKYPLKKGDILFARSGATVGKTYIHQENSISTYAGYLIKFQSDTNKINPNFLYYYTKSFYYEKWIEANTIQATIENISAEKYKNMLIPYPPTGEQHSIVEFLESHTADNYALLKELENQIHKLKEYRQALIYEAVTGKIDVQEMLKETEQEEVSSS